MMIDDAKAILDTMAETPCPSAGDPRHYDGRSGWCPHGCAGTSLRFPALADLIWAVQYPDLDDDGNEFPRDRNVLDVTAETLGFPAEYTLPAIRDGEAGYQVQYLSQGPGTIRGSGFGVTRLEAAMCALADLWLKAQQQVAEAQA